MIDALLQVTSKPYDWDSGPLAGLPSDRKIVLITAHRRESFGEPLREICAAIRELAIKFGPRGYSFVYPVHMNPNVSEPVRQILSKVPEVHLLPPLDYITMAHLMKKSTLILTDSGGIQEEAPSLGVPVLVMREKTERPEAVEAGVARIVGTQRERIVRASCLLLENRSEYASMSSKTNPYGDGKAAQRIASFLLKLADTS